MRAQGKSRHSISYWGEDERRLQQYLFPGKRLRLFQRRTTHWGSFTKVVLAASNMISPDMLEVH